MAETVMDKDLGDSGCNTMDTRSFPDFRNDDVCQRNHKNIGIIRPTAGMVHCLHSDIDEPGMLDPRLVEIPEYADSATFHDEITATDEYGKNNKSISRNIFLRKILPIGEG